MVSTANDSVYYDPYKVEITANPYPVYRRLRQEAPLYYNEEYGFFAVSLYDDVKRGLLDSETFISGRGNILEIIKADVELPDSYFIFKDPPVHTVYRSLVSRMFTPKRMNALEGTVRDLCAEYMDPLVGAREFDLMTEIGFKIPMRVIGLLLGIPEKDQEWIRQKIDDKLRPAEGEPISPEDLILGNVFREYIDWRVENPSDDVITELTRTDFKDHTGNARRLNQEEIMSFVDLLAGAGNETTAKLIGWSAKLLAEHPDQRRDLVKDPSLVPKAIEEILRVEPPPPHIGRYVNRDTEIQGQTIPQGSAVLFLTGSANRDENYFEDPEQFNIHRDMQHRHLTFGGGIHTCIGAVLARMEGRTVLEELLKRFPEWDVDQENIKLVPTSAVRGLERLPVFIP